MKTARMTICFLLLAGFIAQSPLQASEQTGSKKEPGNVASKASALTDSLKKKIVLNDMVSLETERVTDKSDDLQAIIEKMNRLQVPQVKAQEDNETSRKISEKMGENIPTKADGMPADIETAEVIVAKTAELAKNIDDIFEKLLEKPDEIVDPLASGEALFMSNKLSKAAKFYRIALDRNERSENTQTNLSRQWILFQLGNCLRKEDPDESYKYYDQLIGEYPDSNWGPASLGHQQLITWIKESQPTVILERYASDPNSL